MTAITTSNMDGSRRVLKGNPTTHFFVTVVHTGEDTFEDTPEVWKKKHTRCWGYTDSFEKAEQAILENYTDIHECSYQWVIIEEHIMDVFAIGTGLFQWYHWNEEKEDVPEWQNGPGGYERCRQPDWAKSVVHWGIG